MSKRKQLGTTQSNANTKAPKEISPEEKAIIENIKSDIEKLLIKKHFDKLSRKQFNEKIKPQILKLQDNLAAYIGNVDANKFVEDKDHDIEQAKAAPLKAASAATVIQSKAAPSSKLAAAASKPLSQAIIPLVSPDKSALAQQDEQRYKELLKNNFEPPTLIVAKFQLPKSSYVKKEILLLNQANKLNLTDSESTYSGNPINDLRMKLCPIPKSKDLAPCEYKGTIRIDALYEYSEKMDGSFTILPENLLKSADTPIKDNIAFQAEATNPNGVLATSLFEALRYLVNNVSVGSSRFNGITVKYDEDHEEIYDLNRCLQTVDEIRNASRKENGGSEKEKNKFKKFSSALLEAYILELNEGSDSPDKMVSILKVYGSLINKGLSDTAQGGEAIKVWLLKIIELKITMERERERLAAEGSDEAPNPEFWNTVHGIPFLKLISSDKIASALYLRLTKHFKGGVSSIQPVKANGGESSIFYLQQKFIGLIMEMNDGNTNEILGRFYTCAEVLSRKFSFADMNLSIFPKIDEIVKCLYQLTPNSEFKDINFCLRYLEINSDNIQSYIDELKKAAYKNPYNVHNVIEKWPTELKNNIDCIDLLFNSGKGLYNQQLEDFNVRMQNLKTLLECFGILITDLSGYVANYEANLEKKFTDLSENREKTYNFVYSMLAETVGYYDSCKDLLKEKSVDDIAKLYLDICKEELLAADRDVVNGHDQENIERTTLQKLERKFFDILDPSSNERFIQDLNTKEMKEDEFVKKQMDALKYVAITQMGNRDVYFKKTSNINDDPINDHTKAKSFQGVQYSGPVCGQVYSSIDFYVGKVFEIGSKIDINNGFGSFAELMFFLRNHPFKEIRTVSTAADLAAPPGCSYVVSGNMGVSYRLFDRHGQKYIYIISTFNLDTATENTIAFNPGPCISQSTSKSFQTFFLPDELQTYNPEGPFVDIFRSLELTSNKLSGYNKNQKIVFVQSINQFLKQNQELANNQRYFYVTLKGFLDTITQLKLELEKLEGSGGRVKEKIKATIKELRNLEEELYANFIALTKKEYIRLFDLYKDLQQNPNDENTEQNMRELLKEVQEMKILFDIINGVQPESIKSALGIGLAPIKQPAEFSKYFTKNVVAGFNNGSSTPSPPALTLLFYPVDIFLSDPQLNEIFTLSGIDLNNKEHVKNRIMDIYCTTVSKTPELERRRIMAQAFSNQISKSDFFKPEGYWSRVYYGIRDQLGLSGMGLAQYYGGSKRTRKQKRNKRNKRTKKCNGTSKTRRLSRSRRRNRLTKRH